MKLTLKKYAYLLTTILLLSSSLAHAQKMTIEFGKKNIALNETFQITARITGGSFRTTPRFPNIPGFQKQGRSTGSSYNMINGRASSSQSVTQNYAPTKQGTFKVAGFTIKSGVLSASSQGTTIKVGPKKQQQARSRDPFDDYFNRRRRGPSYDFKDVKDNAFLGITCDKEEIYVGEGLHIDFAFYATRADYQYLDFKRDVSLQIRDMLQDLKLPNTWFEEFETQIELKAVRVELNGKEYFKVHLGEVLVFPQNSDDLKIPSLELKMTKYKSAGVKDYFGREVKGEGADKTFYSQPKTVKVKPLPPHPLKDVVAVGRYSLDEEISDKEIDIHDSFIYTVKIKGQGNVNMIQEPLIQDDGLFTFYDPDIRRNILKRNGRIGGYKTFTYDVLPEQPGTHQIGNSLIFIYFDPKKARYDTLIPRADITITGESKTNKQIANTRHDDFYDIITSENNQFISNTSQGNTRIIANSFITISCASIGALAFVYFRRRKEKDNG